MTAALDRSQMSNRGAMAVLVHFASGLGSNMEELSRLSAGTIHRHRKIHRETKAVEIKESFSPTVPLTVDWDRKLMAALTNWKVVDRFFIFVSGEGICKILAAPVTDDKAEPTATTNMKVINEWNLQDRFAALCFDTTATNTGPKRGVCLRLQQILGRDLLNLACRIMFLSFFWRRSYPHWFRRYHEALTSRFFCNSKSWVTSAFFLPNITFVPSSWRVPSSVLPIMTLPFSSPWRRRRTTRSSERQRRRRWHAIYGICPKSPLEWHSLMKNCPFRRRCPSSQTWRQLADPKIFLHDSRFLLMKWISWPWPHLQLRISRGSSNCWTSTRGFLMRTHEFERYSFLSSWSKTSRGSVCDQRCGETWGVSSPGVHNEWEDQGRRPATVPSSSSRRPP